MKYQVFSIKRLSKFCLLFFYTLYFLLYTSPVSAQQLSLSLTPSLNELAIKPGQSVVLKYKFTNIADPSIVTFRILPFEPRDILGNIGIKTSLQNPISFELKDEIIKLDEAFFLKNSASQEILLRVSVPENASEKDYYFVLLAESQPPPPQEGVANVRAKVLVGSNLLITVTKEGQVEILPKISLFEVIPKNKITLFGSKLNLFDSFDKIPAVLVVENKGKNLIKPRGEIALKGSLWQSKKFLILPQTVLAESQRLIKIDSQPDKSLLLSGFFLGSYQLAATVSYGEGTPTLYASTTFIALPIKLTILVTAAIILLLFLGKKLRNH